jgi:hypothetical protein
VCVEIDESRRDNQTSDVNRLATLETFGRDGGDPSVAYADIAHGIESRRRIHHAAALEHDVKRLGLCAQANDYCGEHHDRDEEARQCRHVEGLYGDRVLH